MNRNISRMISLQYYKSMFRTGFELRIIHTLVHWLIVSVMIYRWQVSLYIGNRMEN